jgi:predicted RND superfamily exporter protein
MIITPAILFIVCISDIMHLTNKQSKVNKNKFDFFNLRMNIVGKAVILTSLTTAMSFLTFLVNDILPIVRFGIITSIGVAFTLFVALLIYSISIDLDFNHTKPIAIIERFTDSMLSWLRRLRESRIFHFITAICIAIGIYSVFNVKIDNYLTDEINKKSELFKQTSYFDKYFGGIKPITIFIEKSDITNAEYLKDVESYILSKGFAIDFSSSKMNGMLSKSLNKLVPNSENHHFFVCRTGDIGSLSSLNHLSELEESFSNANFKYSGAGYLFDLLGNDLTKRLIYGLLIAIIAIGIVFFIINNFNINYFLIAIIPNIVPIVVCIGILYQLGFYFSLSNAFIFTIVFGLIIDDSIHVISSYSYHRKRNIEKSKALELIVSNTGLAVIKTTFVVLICLFPLAFSEFKSVSQLSIITIISAIIAIFFDLVYLPLIIKKLTK